MAAHRLNYKAGDRIGGDYLVEKSIGSGSYADVYLVSDGTGGRYALKLLRLWEVAEEAQDKVAGKFRHEYHVARLSSDYLVHSAGFGKAEGNPYMLMEYCPQGDLSRHGGMGREDIPLCARDILEGLHALHTAGKIHRDLKPENVLFRSNGRAALTDFGMVGERDKRKRETKVGWFSRRPRQVLGSPLYMAPEMLERARGGVTYLPTVDIWSFGVMMYELLSGGEMPFGRVDKMSDLPAYQERALRGEWHAGRLRQVADSDIWTCIIERCLMTDYRKRYQSALEVLRDMAALVEVSPVHEMERRTRTQRVSCIEMTQGGSVGERHDMNALLTGRGRMIRVGRETDNDIRVTELEGTYVSRHHFTMERSADGTFWKVRDGQWCREQCRWVESTNGTFINAAPVTAEGQKLFTGDIITAGECKFIVE